MSSRNFIKKINAGKWMEGTHKSLKCRSHSRHFIDAATWNRDMSVFHHPTYRKEKRNLKCQEALNIFNRPNDQMSDFEP